jgi:spore coat polysaccharide biosynthesis predicted glycosyltransferase SpsG
VTVLLVFDEGPGAGLGHRRRVETLAAELGPRGHECRLTPFDADRRVVSGGAGDIVIVDSYRQRADDLRVIEAGFVVAIDDLARDLAVDVVVDPSPGASADVHRRARLVLAGPAYALVPAAAPGAPAPAADAPVDRVLVTTGAADAAGVGARLAASVLAALPAVEVRLVVGQWGSASVPPGVAAVNAPAGLAAEIAAASIVVTAGGVTMLEACRTGRPVVALALVDNQRQGVDGLAALEAVAVATPDTVGETVAALAADARRRLALATAASTAIDGKGAIRVADAIERMVSP